jgi:hypothetical protein
MIMHQTEVFEGYGGSAVEDETKVYTYRGFEIRIPSHPDSFPPDDVEYEYACISAFSLADAKETVNDVLDE